MGLALAAAATGDEPDRPPTPDMARIREDMHQADGLHARALEHWRHGRPAEAIAAAEALIAMRSRLAAGRAELARFVDWRRRFDARRTRASGFSMAGSFADEYGRGPEETDDLLQALATEEMTVHELLAALSEARGDHAMAGRTWGELARIRSRRLGSGNWRVDEARREVDRLDRLAALPEARRRVIERSEGTTAMLAVTDPDRGVTAPDRGLGSAFCIDPRGYFVAGAEAVNHAMRLRASADAIRAREQFGDGGRAADHVPR